VAGLPTAAQVGDDLVVEVGLGGNEAVEVGHCWRSSQGRQARFSVM
jgi:hypothetical protein